MATGPGSYAGRENCEVGVMWFIFHVLQFLPIKVDLHNETCVALENL